MTNWNQGLTGQSKPGRTVQPPGGCTADRCGHEYTGRAPNGMTRVRVDGSREPERTYCKGWCAAYGQALAEIRTLPEPEAAQ
ncbi:MULTISPECIES: hypothetical protein [Streptomycetaceae]|uniref:hypothetical protein n=1 Tax=Streptomycetaceae TaxID=2062 RepID=UPI00035E2C64|nr:MULTISPECIES: hypothetical protein [Streptomycetaceae]